VDKCLYMLKEEFKALIITVWLKDLLKRVNLPHSIKMEVDLTNKEIS